MGPNEGRNNISTVQSKFLLDFFHHHASRAPFGQCYDFAHRYGQAQGDECYLKKILAILSVVLGLDDNGKIPEELTEKFKNNKAVLAAIKQVQSCHGWVVCSAFGKGIEGLIEEYNKELENK